MKVDFPVRKDNGRTDESIITLPKTHYLLQDSSTTKDSYFIRLLFYLLSSIFCPYLCFISSFSPTRLGLLFPSPRRVWPFVFESLKVDPVFWKYIYCKRQVRRWRHRRTYFDPRREVEVEVINEGSVKRYLSCKQELKGRV